MLSKLVTNIKAFGSRMLIKTHFYFNENSRKERTAKRLAQSQVRNTGSIFNELILVEKGFPDSL